MLTNFRLQLEEAGLAHKYQDVLHECARVREELGWAVMVSPFAQLIGTQAVLNVIHDDRYAIVPDEVRKYALGHYGKLLAPIDPDILDRIMENGSQDIRPNPEPLPPAVAELRRRYPDCSDEERLLRFMYAGGQVDEMLAAGPMKTEYSFDTPLVRLVEELAKRPHNTRVFVAKDSLRLEVRHAPPASGRGRGTPPPNVPTPVPRGATDLPTGGD
jgi:oxaloacetate decarboxylase alpha subunit